MATFLKLKCCGSVNSFRRPDFHTYHKTLPLPPKTTIGGFLGSALGISPEAVNDEWLKTNRFQVGVVGKSRGKANDLWQIRKYSTSHLKDYKDSKVTTPYKTAVIVRELLFESSFCLYFSCKDLSDLEKLKSAFANPSWALSLGREDELVRIDKLKFVELDTTKSASLKNTVMETTEYDLDHSFLLETMGTNLMNFAPEQTRLPIIFKNPGYAREPDAFGDFLFVGDFPILPMGDDLTYFDPEEECAFRLI